MQHIKACVYLLSTICALSFLLSAPSAHAAAGAGRVGNNMLETANSCSQCEDGTCCQKLYCMISGQQKRRATPALSFLNQDPELANSLYVPVFHPEYQNLPFQCMQTSTPNAPTANWRAASGGALDLECRIELASNRRIDCESQDLTQARCKAFKKLFEKRGGQQAQQQDAYLWRTEYYYGAAATAGASSTRGDRTGHPIRAFGTPENVCVHEPVRQPGGNARGDRERYRPTMMNTSLRPYKQTAGASALGALQQVLPSNTQEALALVHGGGATPQGRPFQEVWDTGFSARGARHRNAGNGEEYDRTGQQVSGFADAAHLYTPAYAYYNPDDYAPGEEKKLAKKLEGKSIMEVAAAKEFGNPIISESVAQIPGGGGGVSNLRGLWCRINPSICQFSSNGDNSRWGSRLEKSARDYNLQFTDFFQPNANNLGRFLMGNQGGQFASGINGMPGGGLGGMNFNNMLQQIFQRVQQGGGGGGGAGGGAGADCDPNMFGDIEQCVASGGADCGPIAACMAGRNDPVTLAGCMIEMAEQCQGEQQAGGGGGGGQQQQGPNLSQMIREVFGNMGSFGSFQGMQQAMQREKITPDFKATNFSQIMSPEAINAPRGAQTKMPERDHYSPCTTGSCRVTSTHASYNLWAPYGSSRKNAVRCGGKIDRLLRTDVLDSRYDEFNCHIMQRITYNRWCKADPGCCIGCACAPKPCDCPTPCFTSDCWGVTINADTPPCSTRYDQSHDIGFQLPREKCPGRPPGMLGSSRSYCYHPGVKFALNQWAGGGGDVLLNCPEKHMHQVCQELARCFPRLNKTPMEHAGAMDQRGEQAPEGMCDFHYTGLDRPYSCMDSTGFTYGSNTPNENLNQFDGALMCASVGSYMGHDQRSQQVRDQMIYGGGGVPRGGVRAAPLVDFGYNDGDIGFVKNVLAQAGGGGNRSTGGCSYGGNGGRTGGSLGSDGFDPRQGAMTEVMLGQADMAMQFGQNCIPNYDKTFAMGGSEAYVSAALAGTYQVAVSRNELLGPQGGNQGGGAGGREEMLLQSRSFNLHCMGHADAVDAAERFPQAGGGNHPQVQANFWDELPQHGADAAGAILMLHMDQQEGQWNAIPNNAGVTGCSKTTENADFCFIKVPNYGKAPNNCGATRSAGVPLLFRAFQREGDIPETTRAEYRRAGISNFECRTGRTYLSDCVIQRAAFIDPYRNNPRGQLNLTDGRIGAGTEIAKGVWNESDHLTQ